MTRCRAWQRRIPEAVYGDLDEKAREKLERHLALCEECSGLYAGMAETVRKLEVRPAPDAPPQFWESYWDRLERRMAAEAESKALPAAEPFRPRRAFSAPRWAAGAAGALIFLALGIFIGRNLSRPPAQPIVVTRAIPPGAVPGGQTALDAGATPPSLPVRASHYLKRSRVLILAVVNSDLQTEDLISLNLPLQKKTSEELVIEAAALKKEIGSSDRRLERLISDLEMILLQIANLKSDPDISDIEIIKAGVESRDILFKIKLNEARSPSAKSSAGLAPGPRGLDRDRAGAGSAEIA
jgi:hypothetical protein